jgi:hypothetical protein
MSNTTNIAHDERLALLQAISTDILGIERLAPIGKPTADFRVIDIEQLARALEAAYDAGLLVGQRVARGGAVDARALHEMFFP